MGGEREWEGGRRGAPHTSFSWEIGTFRVWNLTFTIHGPFCSEGSQWNAFLLSPLSTPTNCNRCHLGASGSYSKPATPLHSCVGVGRRIVSPLKT